MNATQKFVVAFIIGYFIFVLGFMSRYDVHEPLPVAVRWIPLTSVVLAMVLVAVLSKRAKPAGLQRPDQTGSRYKRIGIAVKVLLVICGLAVLGIVIPMAAGLIPVRLALPGLAVNIGLVMLLVWIMRAQNTHSSSRQ